MIEKDLEDGLRSFGRGFTVLEQDLSEELATELAQAEKVLAKVGDSSLWELAILFVSFLLVCVLQGPQVPGMLPLTASSIPSPTVSAIIATSACTWAAL